MRGGEDRGGDWSVGEGKGRERRRVEWREWEGTEGEGQEGKEGECCGVQKNP